MTSRSHATAPQFRPPRRADVTITGGAHRPTRAESGGFSDVDGLRDGDSYTFKAPREDSSLSVDGPASDVPGRAGAPPTAEIQAAQQQLLLRLGHTFITPEPLATALTHPSWRNERPHVTVDNQRLEFLGDLVLGLAMGDILLKRLPESREGELSVLKAQLVRESTLAHAAEQLGVGPALRLGRGEEQRGGRQRPSVLADAFEAVLGAVFIDAGFDTARAVVERLLAEPIAAALDSARHASSTTALHAQTTNFKTALQERLQQAGQPPPDYEVTELPATPQGRRFVAQVRCVVAGVMQNARAEASSKKTAENAAAEQLFHRLTRVSP
jgi:ribonuclease-3